MIDAEDTLAGAQWTQWLDLAELAPLLAAGTQQSYDGVCRTLLHLHELGFLQWGKDEHGGLWLRTRMDETALILAALDDLNAAADR